MTFKVSTRDGPPRADDYGISLRGSATVYKRLLNFLLVGVPIGGTVFACFYMPAHPPGWAEWSCFLIFYTITGVGIGVGFHRGFTHRSFIPISPVKFALLFAGSLAFQGSVLRWVSDHRRHHRFTDREWDTHSPFWYQTRPFRSRFIGLLHAHFGWMFDATTTSYRVFAPDLLGDGMVMGFHRAYLVLTPLSLLFPYLYGWAIGGASVAFGCLLLGGCVRAALLHQVIWGVNSVGHMLGGRPVSKRDQSRNNGFLAVLTFGEGWHNNHHAAPRSAYNQWRWYQWDLNGSLIRLLGLLGMASEIVTAEQFQEDAAEDIETKKGLRQDKLGKGE